jgi:3',5'-cyclic AMP phosphodiesterase CpdA
MMKSFYSTASRYLSLILLSLLPFAVAGRAERATFAIISDTHVGTRNSVYPAVIHALDRQKVEMIIHTGDAVNKGGSRAQWERFFKITGRGKRLHLAPGNHDLRRAGGYEQYSHFFPETYYSFEEEGTLFFILNTELPHEEGRITGRQFEWLKKELDKPGFYKFVFLHEPLFPLVRFRGFDRHRRERDRLHNLFRDNGVSLVVAGHDHFYSRMVKDGITYVIAPGLGGKFFVPRGKGSFRYILASRMNGRYAFDVVDLSGGLHDHFFITPSSTLACTCVSSPR